MARGNRKVFLLGIDGLPPDPLRRFIAEGRMPRFEALLRRGAVLDVVPTLPPQTAPGWLTIASGAHPSTIGVENILLPCPDQAPNVIVNGFDRRRSRAEYLWETLAREGLRAIVLKYPGSWPPREGDWTQVDGAGGYADITCVFEAAPSEAYVAGHDDSPAPTAQDAVFPSGYQDYWRIDTGAAGLTRVATRPPVGWRGLPAGTVPAFEFVVSIARVHGRARRVLHGLAWSSDGRRGVALSRDKDLRNGVSMTLGAWSDWVMESDEAGGSAYRFKLIDLDLGVRRLHLYRSEAHRLQGFTRPERLAGDLTQTLGPMVEWTGTYDAMNGLVDRETQLEIYAQHTQWLGGAIAHLAASQSWNGFFTHWHVLEYAHHIAGAGLHPEHPLHEPDLARRDVEFLGRVYGLADTLLGHVERVIDDDTLLLVASDHGHDLVHTIFYVNHFLRRHGWLAVQSGDGVPSVNWAVTAAYGVFPGCIHLNVVGRWPGGIVPSDAVDAYVEEIGDALRGLVDPRTKRHVVRLVLDRKDMAAFGVWGERAPDLFFCMDRGYEPASRILHDADPSGEFEITVPGREVTSGHGSFAPFSRSARTLAILAGPGVTPNARRANPVSMIDLAPTLTEFLGIRRPATCDGHPVDLTTLEATR